MKRLSAGLLVLPFLTLACNVILDLSSYKDACPAVEQGKPCCAEGDFQACPYSGPAGTENKGVCKAGRRTCLADGSGFGDCTGEVLPAAAEVCGNGLDDDCNGDMDEGCGCTPGKSEPCYSGPTDTRGVGLCKDGTHVCLDDGHSFGPCAKDVTPAPKDDCSKDGDEDCDGHACADTIFAEAFGDQREQHGTALAVGSDGDIVLIGTFTGDITIGGTSLIAATGDEFVARFDKKGNPKWALQLGLAGALGSAGVAIDSQGAVFVAGTSRDGSAIPLGDVQGVGPIVVAKFTSDGTPVWSRGCGGSPSTGTPTMYAAVGANDAVIFGGSLAGTADCGTGSFGIGPDGLFAAKFSSSGAPVWAKAFGDVASPQATLNGLATDSVGNAWLAGTFAATLDGHAAAGTDAFLYQLSSAGAVGNSLYFGDAADQAAIALDVDASGHPLVLFHNTGTLDLGSGHSATTTTAELALAGFDPLGEANWVAPYDGAPPVDQVFVTMRYDPTGQIVLAGAALGPIDFGGGATSGLSFVTKLDDKGKFVWQRNYGTAFSGSGDIMGPFPQGLGIGPDKDIVLGGTINGTTDFGAGIVLKNKPFDALLFKVGY